MRVAAFDTETTGIPLFAAGVALDKQPRIIELGLVVFDTGRDEITDRVTQLINPMRPLEPIITKITGLTDKDLAEQPRFEEYWAAAANEFAETLTKVDAVFAHNMPFDRKMLEIEMEHMEDALGAFWPKKELCTAELFTSQFGRRPKLKELYAWSFEGKPLPQSHRAVEDAEALMEIIVNEALWELVP